MNEICEGDYDVCVRNEQCVFINDVCFENVCFNVLSECPSDCFGDLDHCRLDECKKFVDKMSCVTSGYGCVYSNTCQSLNGDIFVVSNNGTDENTCGNNQNPCATLDYVFKDLTFNKKVYVNEGNYSLSSITYKLGLEDGLQYLRVLLNLYVKVKM
jgi:hypothetical protein